MVRQQDIAHLQRRLERARLLLLAGRLSEDVAWRLLRRTTQLLDKAEGGEYEPTLKVIYTLIEALWINTRHQRELAELKLRADGLGS
ncbi:MAG: hypothetical protein Kow00105_14900 [Phycisphaeraceae bacterium]